MTQTHETYIAAVVDAAKAMLAHDLDRIRHAIVLSKTAKEIETQQRLRDIAFDNVAKLANIKVCYGLGSSNLRGVTYYGRWSKDTVPHDLIEVCAFGQESWIQVAGTTIHELAHVLAGHGNGHNKAWKESCELLGLRCVKAAGINYLNASFDPKLRAKLTSIPLPTDGTPKAVANALGIVPRAKPCTMGVGTRGGKSRGVGSGSRLLKCSCDQCGYTVRVTKTWLDKGAPICPTDNQPMTEKE